MSARGAPSSGVGLRFAAAGALLTVALVTVLLRGQVVAERYALRATARQMDDARRRVAAARCELAAGLRELVRVEAAARHEREVRD